MLKETKYPFIVYTLSEMGLFCRGSGEKMEIYWENTRRGQKLVLNWDGRLEMIGGVRETKNGFDAFAKTFTMTPERARKGIATMEDAKEFVEQFRPWELFVGPVEQTIETETRQAP